MANKKNQTDETINILQINTGKVLVCVLGTRPMILNRLSEKAKHELLMPRARKLNTVEKASNLKHHPLEEYRAAPYVDPNPQAPTRLLVPSTAFKGAMRSVAMDMPGAAKSQIGRLTYVDGTMISLYGLPQLFMSITRQNDMSRTPDVRTRAIVPEWACYVTVTFVKPILTEQAVVNLLAAAGVMRGVGDWRPEKGAGDFGQFMLVSENDPEFQARLKQGRAVQVAALEQPTFYDNETAELYQWFNEEMGRRSSQGSFDPTKGSTTMTKRGKVA